MDIILYINKFIKRKNYLKIKTVICYIECYT